MDLTRSLVCRSKAFTKSRTERGLDVSSESSESLRLYSEALKKKQTLTARMQIPPYPAAFVAVGKAWPTLENTKPAASAPDAVASNVATERARSRYLSTSVRYEATIATACSCVISVVIGPSYSFHAIRAVSRVVNLWSPPSSSGIEWPSTKEVRCRADGVYERLPGRYPSFTGLGRPGAACQSLKLNQLRSHKRSIAETAGSCSRGRKKCRRTRGPTRPSKVSECRPTTGSLRTANCSALREYGDAHGCNWVREGFHHGTEP